MLIQILSKSLARRICHSLDHRIQRSLSDANRSHAVVDTSGSRNTTNDQEIHTIRGYICPLTQDGLG